MSLNMFQMLVPLAGVDAMLRISNTTAKLRLPDLPFGGYIQSTDAIDLPSLHRWMQDVIWEPVSGKLFQSDAYQQFNSANNAFEYDNDGSPALSQGGRHKKVTEVSTGHAISIFHSPF